MGFIGFGKDFRAEQMKDAGWSQASLGRPHLSVPESGARGGEHRCDDGNAE